MGEDKLLSIEAVIEQTGLSRGQVLAKFRKGELRGLKSGQRTIHVFQSSVNQHIAGEPQSAIATTDIATTSRDANQVLKDDIERLKLEAEKRELEEEARLAEAGLTEREFLAMLEAHAMLKEAYEAQEGKIEELTIKGGELRTEIQERDEDIGVLRHQLEVSEAANKMQIREVSPTVLQFTWRKREYIIRNGELRYRDAGKPDGAWFYRNSAGVEWPLS